MSQDKCNSPYMSQSSVAINKRLTAISSNNSVFKKASTQYQMALKNSECSHKLECKPNKHDISCKKK